MNCNRCGGWLYDDEGDTVCIRCGYRSLAARSILDDVKAWNQLTFIEGRQRTLKKMRGT